MSDYTKARKFWHKFQFDKWDGLECTIEMQDTIAKALRIAERLEQEPSEDMIAEGACVLALGTNRKPWTLEGIYEAMTAQLIKEVNDE